MTRTPALEDDPRAALQELHAVLIRAAQTKANLGAEQTAAIALLAEHTAFVGVTDGIVLRTDFLALRDTAQAAASALADPWTWNYLAEEFEKYASLWVPR